MLWFLVGFQGVFVRRLMVCPTQNISREWIAFRYDRVSHHTTDPIIRQVLGQVLSTVMFEISWCVASWLPCDWEWEGGKKDVVEWKHRSFWCQDHARSQVQPTKSNQRRKKQKQKKMHRMVVDHGHILIAFLPRPKTKNQNEPHKWPVRGSTTLNLPVCIDCCHPPSFRDSNKDERQKSWTVETASQNSSRPSFHKSHRIALLTWIPSHYLLLLLLQYLTTIFFNVYCTAY